MHQIGAYILTHMQICAGQEVQCPQEGGEHMRTQIGLCSRICELILMRRRDWVRFQI